MARSHATIPFRHVTAFVAAGLSWLSTGCAIDPVANDLRLRHPVVVEQRVVKLALATDAGGLAPADDARLGHFLDGYLADAVGPLLVVGSPDAAGSRQVIEARLLQNGIHPSEVQWHAQPASERRDETMRLSYIRADVRLPRCGDWSKPTSFNPTNVAYVNFGCATRRNHALAVALPTDLGGMRRPDARDTMRSDLVIQQYRAGKSTGAEADESAATIETRSGN